MADKNPSLHLCFILVVSTADFLYKFYVHRFSYINSEERDKVSLKYAL